MGDGWNGPLNKVDAFRYEIPRSYKPAMRTNGLCSSTESIVPQLRQDQAPEQVQTFATMPGILGPRWPCPISTGLRISHRRRRGLRLRRRCDFARGIGYDINCGVRLIRTNLLAADVRSNLER